MGQFAESGGGDRKMKNRIPRKFSAIVGKMLIATSATKPSDVIHITKNDFGYLGLNTNTGKYAYYFPSMLRNAEIFEMLEVIPA